MFDPDCAVAASGLIANHVQKFYPDLSGNPPIYLAFDDDDLPEGVIVKATPSDTGDDCHREIDGVGNGALKRALMALPADKFMICDPAGERQLSGADHEALALAA